MRYFILDVAAFFSKFTSDYLVARFQSDQLQTALRCGADGNTETQRLILQLSRESPRQQWLQSYQLCSRLLKVLFHLLKNQADIMIKITEEMIKITEEIQFRMKEKTREGDGHDD